MGCTSSAPNMPEIITNTSDTNAHDKTVVTRDTKEEVDFIQGTTENDLNDTKVSKIEVLPTCDSLEENIQLARDNNSFTNIDIEEKQHDNQLARAIVNENNTETENQLEENKFSTLKEIANQVFMNNILEEIDNTLTPAQEESNKKDNNEVVETEDKLTELVEECNDDEINDNEDDEHIEESASPSQSDGNRSTRWEALADIAAELPPSLAVDPITGQIYSLTK